MFGLYHWTLYSKLVILISIFVTSHINDLGMEKCGHKSTRHLVPNEGTINIIIYNNYVHCTLEIFIDVTEFVL